MKILHLIQKPQLRGAEMFASQLSVHLEAAGHEVVMVSVFSGTAALPFSGKMYDLKANAGLRFTDIKAWRKLAAIIKKEKPDIIQANAGDTLKYAVFSKLLFRWKQPLVFRNASVISLYIKSRIVHWLNAFFFRRVQAIISVSNKSALDIATTFSKYNNTIITIPVGIEEDLPGQHKAADITLKGKPVLVHVGGFSFEKNHAGLIVIFKQVLQKYPAAVLHLVGDGPMRQQIQELVQEKKLTNEVVFHGFQKNPLQYIRQADALLLPSIIEGLPGVVLEAFYCKTPVVAYDTGGVSEVVINNKTGILVTKENESAFVAALITLLEDKAQAGWLIANGYELVTTGYLNKHIAERFVKAYRAILRKDHKKENSTTQVSKKIIQNEYI